MPHTGILVKIHGFVNSGHQGANPQKRKSVGCFKYDLARYGIFEVVEQHLLNTFFITSTPLCLFWPPRDVYIPMKIYKCLEK